MSVENPGSTPATPAAAAVAAPAATTATATTGTPAPGVQAPAAPQTVTIPLEQLQVFTSVQARLAQLESEQRERDEKSRADQVKLLTAKGEIEKAMAIQQEEARNALNMEKTSRAAMEERAKRYALDGEVSRVLASQPLVPGGAEQLTVLWRQQFIVDPTGDSFTVRTPTFQSVGDFVAAQLARPEYAHFIRAQNPGGGTSGGGASASLASPTSPANPTPTPEPKNFSEAIILHMQGLAKAAPSDNRLNPAAAMGLNARSIHKSQQA